MHTTCYRCERWQTPAGGYVVGRLPVALQGSHLGPRLRSYILYQSYQQHVTQPLIVEHLRELGVDLHDFDPLAQGYGPLFNYLDTLTDPVERIAAGQFTREAIAVVKNQQFIDWCEAGGHTTTAALYRDIIQQDEAYHHLLGRDLLLRLAATPEAQERATQAATRTLELAEELQHLALTKMGVHHAPGC